MSRGLANHSLYLARLVVDAWERDRVAQVVPARTLDQAYAPAVREHLITAYGQFLLHVYDPTGAAAGGPPPRCCNDLPAQAAGKALAGEIREFRQLEQAGWLADMLAPLPAFSTRAGGSQTPGTLAVTTGAGEWPEPEQAAGWCYRLERIFQRMDDSLEEC